MPNEPQISVIVPCYNADRYLNVCLESLHAQREPEIEMICIDDGSTDATGAMLDAFANRDDRARVLHVPNAGVSAARNLGIARARGHYIAFVDADDALEEGGLLMLYRAAVRSGAQITSADHALFDMKENRRISVHNDPVLQQPLEIAREIIHMHRVYNNLWNKLYMRSLFEEGLALDERVHIGEDALLNLRLYLRAHRVEHVQQTTYVYRVHKYSAMARIDGYSRAHQPMLRAMSEILLEEGVKELFFRDFLQSCVWIDEKEKGIHECMRTFDVLVRPLVMDGINEERIPAKDRQLYRLVKAGNFPIFYKSTRVWEKLTGKRWGIRR